MPGASCSVIANVTPRPWSHHSMRWATQRRASAIGYGDGTWIRNAATRRSPAPAATAPASLERRSRSTKRSVTRSGGRGETARAVGRIDNRAQPRGAALYGICSRRTYQKMPGPRPRAYHLAAAALVALGPSAAAHAAVQDVHTHRLDNGVTLHVAPGHPAPVAAVQAWLGVGSADEAA